MGEERASKRANKPLGRAAKGPPPEKKGAEKRGKRILQKKAIAKTQPENGGKTGGAFSQQLPKEVPGLKSEKTFQSGGKKAHKKGKSVKGTGQIDPTREIAFDILEGVLEKSHTLEGGFSSVGHHQVEARDKAAAHRIAACVLRHLGTLEEVILPHVKRQPPLVVKIILLIGAAQLLFLETPSHAAVSTCVNLAKRRHLAPFGGLVNAVLRRVVEGGAVQLEELDQDRLDVPAWLWRSWGRKARLIAEALSHEAPLDITLKKGAPQPPGGQVLPNGSIRFPAGTRPVELAGFAEGNFWVQDSAATLPARVLNVQAGERVFDLCAAPGGKTAQLADAGGQITAVERDAKRMLRLAENMTRLGFKVEEVIADLLQWAPPQKAQAILLDAPCSATGTARRHPDVLRNRKAQDIRLWADQQERLLKSMPGLLEKGGRLVYSVCSLQPEEGVAHLDYAQSLGFVIDPIPPEELPFLPPEAFGKEGYVATHPGMWAEKGGMDGFFILRLRKVF
ncbi:RsmB/NOP family class I SAM-dependent RNA methyltransferase [Entomobacter blattae]|nr:transcription antitermination factor NusB [Entomobacter blattae]